jgi:biopolymer transport protein ExbB
MRRIGLMWGVAVCGLLCAAVPAAGQADDPTGLGDLTPSMPPVDMAQSPEDFTLWEMIQEGGAILWVIVGLSVVAAVMALYFFFTITPGREVPKTFMKRAMTQLRAGDLRGAYQMCEGRDELIANVLRAGLKVHNHDRYVIQDAMEGEGERGATALWQRVSYLNNIGVIAPLLGLLGTVWGMIRAFGAIALEDAEVKSISMAYSVAQAMITTAAGLVLAIPAMVAYFYLRGRVIKIVATVEQQASEIIEVLSRSDQE